jgi:phosphatidyl-myo-inositol dimannoside synthase
LEVRDEPIVGVLMNILVLATDAFGGYGGIAQYNRDFVEALCETYPSARVEVLVRLGTAARSEIPANAVQFKPVRSRIGYAAFAVRRALKFKPNIVVSAHLYHGPLALWIAQLTGARLISQLHGTEVWRQLSPAHLVPLERSDIVFCVSRDTRRRLIEQVSALHERAVVVSNTVGVSFCPGDRSFARKKFNLNNEYAVLTVARLAGPDGYKGHDRVMKLLPKLASRLAGPVVYCVAGVGEDRDRLERLSQTLGVAHMVRFLGKVPHDDLPDLYRASDLFALPSTGEGFGIATIEAMACGTPAIGLAVGGASDALADGELGFCVAPQEFESAFFAAMDACRARDPALPGKVQARFGRAAFQTRVAACFSNLIRTVG